MKRIAFVGFAGWAGIVWLAWTLADARLDACRYSEGWTCALRATAARDATLINGLTVALVGLLALMFVTVRPDQRGRLSRLRPSLPDMLNSLRSRRWLIGVAAAAALSAIIWFTARPAQWLGAENAPAGMVAVVASDAVADPADALDSVGPDVGSAVGDEDAKTTAYQDAKDAASEDIQPAEWEGAPAAHDVYGTQAD